MGKSVSSQWLPVSIWSLYVGKLLRPVKDSLHELSRDDTYSASQISEAIRETLIYATTNERARNGLMFLWGRESCETMRDAVNSQQNTTRLDAVCLGNLFFITNDFICSPPTLCSSGSPSWPYVLSRSFTMFFDFFFFFFFLGLCVFWISQTTNSL